MASRLMCSTSLIAADRPKLLLRSGRFIWMLIRFELRSTVATTTLPMPCTQCWSMVKVMLIKILRHI